MDKRNTKKERYSNGSVTKDTLAKGRSKFKSGRKMSKGFLGDEELAQGDTPRKQDTKAFGNFAGSESKPGRRHQSHKNTSDEIHAGRGDLPKASTGDFINGEYPTNETGLQKGFVSDTENTISKAGETTTTGQTTATFGNFAESGSKPGSRRQSRKNTADEIHAGRGAFPKALTDSFINEEYPADETGFSGSSFSEARKGFVPDTENTTSKAAENASTKQTAGTFGNFAESKAGTDSDQPRKNIPNEFQQDRNCAISHREQRKTSSDGFFSSERPSEMKYGSPEAFVKTTSTDYSSGFKSERNSSSPGFRTIQKSYAAGKKYVTGMGRFTNAFVKSTTSDTEKLQDASDQTVNAGRHIVQEIHRAVRFIAKQMINLVKLLVSLLTGGIGAIASGCFLPVLLIFIAFSLLIVLVVAVVIIGIIILVNIVLLIIDAMFAADIGGSGMYAYAYECAVAFQEEYTEALEEADIKLYINDIEQDIQSGEELEVDYVTVFLMYLGINETAWYADTQLNLMADSAESCLQELLEDTDENRELYDALFNEMYALEVDGDAEEPSDTEDETETDNTEHENNTEAGTETMEEETEAETDITQEETGADADEGEKMIILHIYTWNSYRNSHLTMSDVAISNVDFLLQAYQDSAETAQSLGAGEKREVLLVLPEQAVQEE